MNDAILDHENREFCELYADTFFDGAYWHSVALQSIETSTKNETMSQDMQIDCCYHAGSAVELFIYGVLALDGDLNILWQNTEKEGTEYFSLPFHDTQQHGGQKGNVVLHGIIGRRSRSISAIREKLKKRGGNSLFPENSDREGILLWLENLSLLRNKAIHANTSLGEGEDALCRFNVFREYVRRTFRQSDSAYKALVVNSKQSPFAGAEKRLFQRWYVKSQERFANFEQEDCYAQMERLEEERERVERRWRCFEDLHGGQYARCEIDVVQCPICGAKTTRSKFVEPPHTFWMGLPNNSCSVLYAHEENHLECMCCIAKDNEEMHWTRLEIKHYEALYGPLCQE